MEEIRTSQLNIESTQKQIVDHIKRGSLFIYPTDTVYGIGCNALNADAVEKIRAIKKTDHPFSVIAPSKSWILSHTIVPFPDYLEKFPGPYTLIVEKKKHRYLEHVCQSATLGVRIPAHVFTAFVHQANVPFITTSVNYSGKPHAVKTEKIPKRILNQVDIVINDGPLTGSPSQIFDLTGRKPREIKRSDKKKTKA